MPVAASRRAVPLTADTRPVSIAYSARASVRLPDEAPGKFVVLNRPAAGSNVVLKPKLMIGTTS